MSIYLMASDLRAAVLKLRFEPQSDLITPRI
jgi:hypothetical protein